MLVPKELIEQTRRVLIQLLNTLDDILGIPRTIPDKEARRRLREMELRESLSRR